MKNLILLLTILSFTTQSLALDKILLISPLVRIDERDLPQELDKSYKTFSRHYLESVPKQRNVENLLNEFENAQKYYLVKSYDLARQYYEKVVAYSDVDEWKDIHRKIIFLSYIRLSELDKNNQREWITSALRFSLETDPKKLDLEKGSLNAVLDIKKGFAKNTLNWQVSPLKNDFSYILINGHVIDLRKIETVKIPSGKFRVTFLSDVYKPQTYQLSSQQIPLLTPTRIPFVSGTCEKSYYNNEGEISADVTLYYSKDCIKNQVGKQWVSNKESKIENLEPIAKSEFASHVQYNEEPFYKKKWFLVTMGVVLVGAGIYAANANKKEKPTHENVNGY